VDKRSTKRTFLKQYRCGAKVCKIKLGQLEAFICGWTVMHKKRNVFRTKSQCFHANYVYVIAFFTQARNMPNGKARST